jgi:hypothetical protein
MRGRQGYDPIICSKVDLTIRLFCVDQNVSRPNGLRKKGLGAQTVVDTKIGIFFKSLLL